MTQGSGMRLPDPGDLFIDRFELLEELGRGGFACVFGARDRQTKRDIALKILMPTDDGYSQLSGARFVREARVIASLQHPSTVTLLDFGQTPEQLLWMAFEFVSGKDLRLTLGEHGPLPAPIVSHILRQLLGALAEAHGKSVIHRDIKPANVLIHEYDGDPWRAKLLDFGLAKPVNIDATQLTASGKISGTPRYMSPEQVLALDLGPPSDIYSLGLTAYEMLTGVPAIDGDTMKELLQMQVRGPTIRLPEDSAPPAMRRIVERMVTRQIAERYQTVAEIQRELRAARSEFGPPPQTKPVSHEAMPQRSSPRRIPLALALGAGGLLALVFVGLLLQRTTTPAPTPRADDTQRLRAALHAAPTPRAASNLGVGRAAPDLGVPQRGMNCAAAEPGFQSVLVASGRRVLVYVPRGYDPSTGGNSVLLVLHTGGAMTPRDFIDYTNLTRLADENGVILVAPPRKTGLVGRSWSAAPSDAAWDAARVVQAEFCADPERLFLFAEAQGYRAVHRLICRHPEQIAAAAVTGNRHDPGDVSCTPADPVPYIHFTQAHNRYLPIAGGPGCDGEPVWSLEQQTQYWQEAWGCEDTDRTRTKHPLGECTTYQCPAPLVSCLVEGGTDWTHRERTKHESDCAGRAVDFPYHDVMWDFFDSNVTPSDR